MQSYIEVDEEDLYTLKINCKEKKNNRKSKQENKCRKNNNSFKKLKLKKAKRKKKENCIELLHHKVEAEV